VYIYYCLLLLFQSHSIALEFTRLIGDKLAGGENAVQLESATSRSGASSLLQCRIDSALHFQAQEAYCKLLTSVYILAVNGQPLSSFKTLVRTQKDFKCVTFHHFFTVLSDGSQACKVKKNLF
jgi:hypothetical protein